MLEVTGLIDLTVSFVQPQTPGGVDAYSYRLPTASKGVVGGRIFEERRSIGEVDEVELLERLSGAESSGRTERSGAERRGADRSGMERDSGDETRLTLMC